MDRQAIEQTALHAVEDRVNLTKFLSSFLDSNDKTPTWDGSIYIFHSDKKTKDNLTGRLPAQIKGHEDKDFSKDSISYSIEIADLRNYLNDGGAVLFVVYVTPNDDLTAFLSKVYFTELTPVKISSLISKCPIIQQHLSLHLKQAPTKPEDFASMVLNCYLNCKRQSSFAGVELPSVAELQEQGILESIQMFVSGYGAEYQNIHAFLKIDTPLYVRIKGSAIPQPLKYEGEMLEKTIAFDLDHEVISNGIVFYKRYRVVETLKQSTIHIGSGITITFKHGQQGCKFNYKAPHMMRQFVNDAPFMIAFARTKTFMIDDIPFDFSQCDIEPGNFSIEALESDYSRLSRYVKMLDEQGCPDDLDYTKLSNEDWRNLERLAQATLDNKPVYGLRDDCAPIMAMDVGPLKFAVGLTHIDGESGAYTLCHVQECKDIIWCSPDHSEATPVPIAAIFKPDDYIELSNIRFDQILPAIQAFPVNTHTYGIANQIMLNMIMAADHAQGARKKTLLQTALGIADWLSSMPDEVWEKDIATLNRLQIIIRERVLTEEERACLYVMTMKPNSREDILFAAYALLGKKDDATRHFTALPLSTQEELKHFPIYYFLES